MNFLKTSLLLASISASLALATSPAHAQVLEAYAEGAVAHVSNAESGANFITTPYGLAGGSSNYTSFSTGAFMLGATINGWPRSVVSLGVDVRADIAPGNPGYVFVLEGLKVTAKPKRLPFQPYFEVAVSAHSGHTGVPNTTTGITTGPLTENPYKNGYYIYQGYLGADYRLRDHLAWRVVEVGGGTSVGSGHNGITMLTVGTGVVARF